MKSHKQECPNSGHWTALNLIFDRENERGRKKEYGKSLLPGAVAGSKEAGERAKECRGTFAGEKNG